MKSIIKTLFFIIALLVNMQLASCAGSGNNDGNKHGIRGRFVNYTVLKDIADTIPGGIPAYCFEMNFVSDDSVELSNGFEDYKLAYTKNEGSYLLLEASFKGNMPFTFINDSTLLLIDTAWTNNAFNSEFRKVHDNKQQNWVFDYYLNQVIVVGEYTLYNKNIPLPQKVVFKADGHVSGLDNYTTYSICYSGDCIGETIPPSNTITLSDNSGKAIDFAFKINKKNKALSIYKIEAPVEDVKGEMAIKEMLYELKK